MVASSTAMPTSSLLLPPMLLLLLLLTLVSSLLLLLFSLVRKISSGRTGAQRLPPGSEGFPLVGETLRLISAYKTETPDSFIDERVRKHRNRIFRSHVFGERTVFSADPEVNRLVLQSEGKLFESSYPTSITTLLGRHSLLLTRAAYHRRMHSLTLSSFSNPAVLRDLLLPDIHRVVHRNLRSWGLDDRVFSLLDQAKKITFELAVRQLMSCEPGEWTEGLRREYLLLINGFFCVPLPLPFTTYGRALRARAKVAHQIRMVVRNRIAEHAAAGNVPKTMGCIDKNKNHRDVLDRLLADGVREEEEVVDFLLALLVAAYETTPTAMTLAIKFLTETPAALARLREEHDRVRERKQPRERGSGDGHNAFDWVDYKTAMPFTHSVINETLRISNVISGVFRRATTDVHIKGGYVIPKGCKVFASFRAVHMDQEHFEDARTFNPWRWHRRAEEEVDRLGDETENQEEETKRRGKSSATHATTAAARFCVFGGGARLCPGHELARVELCVFLHHLLTTFSWDAAEEDKLVFFPTTRTLKGYPIRVRPRCPAPTEI